MTISGYIPIVLLITYVAFMVAGYMENRSLAISRWKSMDAPIAVLMVATLIFGFLGIALFVNLR